MKFIIYFTILFSSSLSVYSSGYKIQGDTIYFTSEKLGLKTFTQNIDSIQYFPENVNYPQPFAPSMMTYAVRINTYDTTALIINIKNNDQKNVVTFKWNKIPPGAYINYWWEYIGFENIQSGVYFIEKITNKGFETSKAVIVK